ncbi:MAG: fibronectin type III domain-containing protein [Bacteroidales bacterium]|nr:fibronectin type III domain-containing protein [Bacteroidales bacterium]
MNIKILNHRIALASILFVFAISLQSKAQDTIHCFDERYHWTYPCNYSDYPDTVFDGPGVVSLTELGHMTHDPKPVLVGAVDKTLIQQVFTDTIRKQIYGIAGTTIGCYNPNGCYFYLYKKINNTFVVLDSAEWTHRNATDTEKRYIAYNVGGEFIWEGSLFDIYGDWPTSIPGETLTLPDSNIVEIHEAYFNTPIAVEDTFYVGTNWNGIDVYPGQYDTNQSFFWLEQPYTSTFIVPLIVSDTSHYTTWVTIYPDNTVYVNRGSSHRNCFFPIMEPPQCAPINVVSMDSLTTNSVYISWERPYLNTYYQIEYGPRGFQHGSGVFIDSVATTHYTLQNLAAGTEYIAYVRSFCSSADTVSGWKSVQFKTLHTECPAVEDLAAYEGTRIASIKWSITDSEIAFCQIEWGEAGFEHGNGTVVNNIHDTTYLLRNLTANTTYDVYLRTYCERSGVFGAWQHLTFTTDGGNNAIADTDNDIPVELHPNPTSGIITLSRTDVQRVDVIDAVGKTVMVVEDKHVIDLSKLSQGYYTLRITLPEGVAIRKVIRK